MSAFQDVEALILAGGKGTRLASKLGGRPKPLVEVAGIPLLQRQLEYCRAAGLQKARVLVNHLAEQIADFCHQHDNFGLDLSLVDDGEPKGTAGATLAAVGPATANSCDLLIIYGDTLLNVDLPLFHAFHQSRRAEASLLLHPNNHPYDSDLVEIDESGRLTAIHPYPRPDTEEWPNLVNAALYFISHKALEPWLHFAGGTPEIIDFAKHLFPKMLEAGQKLFGYVSPEYIKDVGTPERLEQAEADLASGRFATGTLRLSQTAVFLDRDGVINEERGHLAQPDDLHLLPDVAPALARLNQSGQLAVLITNQPVLARGECDEDGLKKIFNRLETLLGRERAYLDRVYYCPHHPHKGFAGERVDLKIVCGCRKPAPGMVLQAARDLNINLPQSWFIGDRTSDLACADAAGVSSILVGTGAAGQDGVCPVAPDFKAPDLAAAISFILDRYPRLVNKARAWLEEIMPGQIIIIGGLAHSGKSTLASLLKRELQGDGLAVEKICLDGFLKPVSERGPGVMERYDLTALKSLASTLARRSGPLELPFYQRHSRSIIPAARTLNLNPETIYLLEGVPALSIEALEAIANHLIWVDGAEKIRKERFASEYLSRQEGKNWENLFQQREKDERPIIERSLRRPDLWIWDGNLQESTTIQ